jgi:hypothetical protein
MAGDWLKIQHDTPDKPEIMRIAAQLGISIGDAFLACFRVWRWADNHTKNGNAAVTLAAIDVLANVNGFGEAMRAVSWLSVDDTGAVSIPRFKRHISKSAKQRALAARRKQCARSRKSHAGSVTTTRPQRESKSKKEIPPHTPPGGADETPLPCELNTPEFRAAWSRWLDYRAQQRVKSYKPLGLKTLFAELATYGPEVSIEAIRRSMANGWQGLFPDKVGGSTHGRGNGVGQPLGRIAARPGEYNGIAKPIGPGAPAAAPGGPEALAEGQGPRHRPD